MHVSMYVDFDLSTWHCASVTEKRTQINTCLSYFKGLELRKETATGHWGGLGVGDGICSLINNTSYLFIEIYYHFLVLDSAVSHSLAVFLGMGFSLVGQRKGYFWVSSKSAGQLF